MAAAQPIRFSTPFRAPHESAYVEEALASGLTSGDGPFTARASESLRPLVGGGDVLLTTSCTNALEMTAILLDLKPGDEVILPSFTFVSTVNAYVLRGAVPVFVDIRPDTLNLDERQIEAAITEQTKAIVVVHYGGVACEMDTILAIAAAHDIAVIEDNAHGLDGRYKGGRLGSFGVMATQSFHATKNINCGEGGALVCNDPELMRRAEILREKGTNRSEFFRGMVDKYRWMDVGSSYLPSDILAAVLTSQLEYFTEIQAMRHAIWSAYHTGLSEWARKYDVQQPVVPDECQHPAHVYQLLLPTAQARADFIAATAAEQITTPFHYVPLHDSVFGSKVGRVGPGGCEVTSDVADRLVRLPLFAGLGQPQVDRVIDVVSSLRPGG